MRTQAGSSGFAVTTNTEANELRAGHNRLERQVALNVDVALEAASHTHISRPLDLALDRQIRGDDGLTPLR